MHTSVLAVASTPQFDCDILLASKNIQHIGTGSNWKRRARIENAQSKFLIQYTMFMTCKLKFCLNIVFVSMISKNVPNTKHAIWDFFARGACENASQPARIFDAASGRPFRKTHAFYLGVWGWRGSKAKTHHGTIWVSKPHFSRYIFTASGGDTFRHFFGQLKGQLAACLAMFKQRINCSTLAAPPMTPPLGIHYHNGWVFCTRSISTNSSTCASTLCRGYSCLCSN